MYRQQVGIQSFLDQGSDALYQFFNREGSFLRYVFGTKYYRVTYSGDNGVSSWETSEIFSAAHDRAAQLRAREFTEGLPCKFRIERYREII